jgi:hypothetical protein
MGLFQKDSISNIISTSGDAAKKLGEAIRGIDKDVQLAVIDVFKTEAQSSNFLVSFARPCIMYIIALNLLFQTIIYMIQFFKTGKIPTLELNNIISMGASIVGFGAFGAMRTIEKINGVVNKH